MPSQVGATQKSFERSTRVAVLIVHAIHGGRRSAQDVKRVRSQRRGDCAGPTLLRKDATRRYTLTVVPLQEEEKPKFYHSKFHDKCFGLCFSICEITRNSAVLHKNQSKNWDNFKNKINTVALLIQKFVKIKIFKIPILCYLASHQSFKFNRF